MNKIYRNWAPVLVWCGLIFYLSSVPDLKSDFGGVIDLFLRKGAHITEYAVLFLLNRRAFSNSFTGWRSWKAALAAIVFSVVYAAGDEYHQSFVPTRGPSVIDVAIDSAGAAAGYLIYRYWKGIRERSNEI